MDQRPDPRRHSPAAARNADAILDVLRPLLPAAGVVLEIAAGTGEHAVHFAGALPHLAWQPSDPDADARASIEAWRGISAVPNLRPAIALDVTATPWPLARADAIVCINMIHISPWAATEHLMRGAASLLPAGAPLYLYGPFIQSGVVTAASNAAFDAGLKARDPAWGLRDLADVAARAAAEGLVLQRTISMPANNLSLIFRRS